MYQWIRFGIRAIAQWDWKAIIACFLTACVFWTFHSLNGNHSASLSIPLKVEYDTNRFVLLKPAPAQLWVQAKGHGWNLLRAKLGIGLEAITFQVLSHHTRQVPKALLESKITDALKDFKLELSSTDALKLSADTLVVQKLEFELPEEDIPTGIGFRLTSPVKIQPSYLLVKGPASVLSSLKNPVPLVLRHTDSIRGSFEGEAYPALASEAHITGLQNLWVKFDVSQFVHNSTRAVLLLENFPKKKRIKVSPEIAFLQYWVKKDEEGLESTSPVLILDYYQINWLDSTIVPSIELANKYVDPIAFPNKFKIQIE